MAAWFLEDVGCLPWSTRAFRDYARQKNEALAHGVPTVTTLSAYSELPAGTLEVLAQDARAGVIAAEIVRLLRHPHERARLRRAAVSYAKDALDSDTLRDGQQAIPGRVFQEVLVYPGQINQRLGQLQGDGAGADPPDPHPCDPLRGAAIP